MKPLEIRIALLRRGYSNSRVAKELRLTRSTVGDVISGRQKSLRVALKIAEVTKLPVDALWPGRYGRRQVGSAAAGIAARSSRIRRA